MRSFFPTLVDFVAVVVTEAKVVVVAGGSSSCRFNLMNAPGGRM